MSNQLATVSIDNAALENVLIGGDLSKLTPTQRVSYYKAVCQSIGLNPLTRPFDYITLNGKLTLYAKKDAADQLRNINNVSIDDIDIVETGDSYVVKVKGHDNTGRSDVEIGVVKKTDMQGNTGNAQMKAVTKAKRRLTLSLCGLGWLDETEVETIPSAQPVTVTDNGEIIDAETAPSNNGHKDAAPEDKKPERPYEPEVLKKAIAAKVAKMGNPLASDKQIGLLASMLNKCFAGETNSSDLRHAVQQYLTGYKSSKDMPGAYVKVLLDWLDAKQDDGGDYTPSAMAIKEAQAIRRQALIDAGQMDLLATAQQLGGQSA